MGASLAAGRPLRHDGGMILFLFVLAAIVAFAGLAYRRKAQRARQIDLLDAQRTAMAQLRDGSGRRPDDR